MLEVSKYSTKTPLGSLELFEVVRCDKAFALTFLDLRICYIFRTLMFEDNSLIFWRYLIMTDSFTLYSP